MSKNDKINGIMKLLSNSCPYNSLRIIHIINNHNTLDKIIDVEQAIFIKFSDIRCLNFSLINSLLLVFYCCELDLIDKNFGLISKNDFYLKQTVNYLNVSGFFVCSKDGGFIVFKDRHNLNELKALKVYTDSEVKEYQNVLPGYNVFSY